MTRLIHESDPRASILRDKLNRFYQEASNYSAFQTPSNVEHFWPLLIPLIEAVCRRRGNCRILEFGAGRTGFGLYLRTRRVRAQVDFTVHDVTDQNLPWLKQQGDAAIVGSVTDIVGEYDLIFSTFVVEHMTDPKKGLSHLWSMLAPKGTIYVTCPRYDLPFYLPPSCDHLAPWARFTLALRLIGWRLRTLLTKKPAFGLLDDLALFYLPWARDRDAVHLASYCDLRAFFLSVGGRVKKGRNIFGGNWRSLMSRGGFKDWVVKRYLTICIQADRI